MSTRDQSTQLEQYRTRWHQARLSTASVDRMSAERGVEAAYRAAGLAPPQRIVWCDGPIAMARDWEASRRGAGNIGSNVRHAVLDRVQMQAVTAVRACARRDVWISAVSGVRSSQAENIGAEVLRVVTLHARQIRHWQTTWQVASLGHLLVSLFRARRPPASWPAFGRSSFSQHELGWLGAYQYLHDFSCLTSETEVLDGLWQLGLSAGWVLPHEKVCWLAERHDVLQYDDRGRLHCATGPALAYPDGWRLYSWRGIEIPAELIEQRHSITLDGIDAQRDILVRRCMIEIIGPKNFITQGGATRVAQDETGMLWRRSWWNGDTWAAVEVVNGTISPDGTREHYVLQVPPEMRTARAAVAWTYGISEQQYASLGVRT